MKQVWMLLAAMAGLLSVCQVNAALSIEQWQTPKGATVLYAQAEELPMVDVRVVFNAGSARDAEQAGLAYLTNQLIGAGDATQDEESFAEQTEALGMQFSTQSLKDMAVVSMRSLSKAEILQPAVALAAQALQTPRFEPEIVERYKAQLLTSLTAKQQSPAAVASEHFWQLLYGQHPYAHASSGRIETVKQLTETDLRAFYQQYYTAQNATVAIVGQVDRATAEALAIQLVDGLATGSKVADLPVVQAETSTQFVAFPATQTQVMLGQLGVNRADEDYIPLYIANHILGGSGFASRLMEEVREKRGLVYGVSSALIPMAQQGPWMVSLQTATDNATEALQVVKETLSGMLQPISEAELTEHKDNIIGSFALEVDSNKEIVSYLAMMGFYNLPLDWLATFPEKVAQVDVAQLNEVIQRRLQPDTWSVLVLGAEDVATESEATETAADTHE